LLESHVDTVGAATGVGFLIGVWIGGTGSVMFGYTKTMWIAMSINVLSVLVALFGLKETLKSKKEEKETKSYLERVKGLFSNKELTGLATSAMMIICLGCSANSSVGEYPRVALGMSPKERGYLFMVLGIVNSVSQASISFIMRVVQRVTKKTAQESEVLLVFLGAMIVSVSVLSIPFTSSITEFLCSEIMWGIGGSLSIPMLYGMVSKAAPEGEQGILMGMLDSCGNLGIMLGPIFGNVLLEKNRILPFVLCVSGYVLGVAKLSMNISRKKKEM
jgi:DHA1 family tetracycline resistance protein-like MFS transporter